MMKFAEDLNSIISICVAVLLSGSALADDPGSTLASTRGGPNEHFETIVTFDDLTPNGAVPITDNYAGFEWDYDADDESGHGWGWHPFAVASSVPYDGINYVLNGHGQNMLGITFPRPVFFNGAFFTKTSRRESLQVDNPDAYSAERIRVHYYNPGGQKLGVTDWFELCAYPRFLRLERQVGRIVVEHDGAYTYDNSNWGVPEARWFSMDHMLLNFHPNVDPEPYCVDENNNCVCDINETEIVGPPLSPVNFEDTPADQSALVDHANIAWDHTGIFGLAVYDAKSSDPYDGNNYILNLHGKQFNGMSFGEPTYFNGAFFARCSRRWWVDRDLDDAYSADSLRLHYYSADGSKIGKSGWFVLNRFPTWYPAEVTCSRIVIEHDGVDGFDNSDFGVPSAKWFAVDYFLFNEPPGTEPPPYGQGGAGQPESPVTFDDIAALQTQLVDHANIIWDHPDIFGFSVYDAASSVPYDGDNFILNLHGIRELGFSFHEPTFFNGAFFTKCSRRWDIDRDLPQAYSADSLMLHYYDENDQLIGSSPWIVLNRDPKWFAVEMTVGRVVVEHDGQNGWDNSSIGEPNAQWYSIDHMVFNMPAGYEPPPYGGIVSPPLSPVTFDDINATQQPLTSHSNVEWDKMGDIGFGVYDAESSDPYDGMNYILNRHGVRMLGFTLQVPSYINGAFFARCSIRETVDRDLPEAYSADSLRLHYYDENDQLIGMSDWFTLQRDPTWFAIEQTLSRVVIEHDAVDGWDNSQYGEPSAKWYAVDHLVFDEPAGFEPPPYCVDEDNDGICDGDPIAGPPQSPVDFDDAIPDAHALHTYANIDWDREGTEFGWGWGVYNTTSSLPATGNQFLMNLHGKNFLGFTLGEEVMFEGAYFTRGSINMWLDVDDPRSHSADSLRMHYFDSRDNLIGNSGWFPLDKQPQWIAVNQVVARVVVEHDTVNAFANDPKGEPLAKWYSIDHLVFSGGGSVASVEPESDLALTQNYPNPFNPSTVIRFNLPSDDRIELAIYNILGQKVRVLANGEYVVGLHEVEWYGDNNLGQKVSAGVYFYRLVTSSATMSRKMIMVK